MDEALEKRLDKIEKSMAANDRALRGYDSTPGLVADVKRVEGKIDNIHTLLSNDLEHVKEGICKDIQLLKQSVEARDEKSIKWPWFKDKLLVPIIVSVFTALLIAWLVIQFGLK